MIINEVNISIAQDVRDSFAEWLKVHAQDMVATGCFKDAKYFEVKDFENPAGKSCKFTTHYFADSLEDLDRYLNNYAAKLRQDGIDKFGGQFNASRRLLTAF